MRAAGILHREGLPETLFKGQELFYVDPVSFQLRLYMIVMTSRQTLHVRRVEVRSKVAHRYLGQLHNPPQPSIRIFCVFPLSLV
jgi:hypothetical protein